MLNNKEIKLIKAYSKIYKHKQGVKTLEIEDINDILLSKEFFTGQYGIDNFLDYHYKQFMSVAQKFKEYEAPQSTKKGMRI